MMCEVTGANQLPFFKLPTVHPFTHCKREILLSVALLADDAVDAIKMSTGEKVVSAVCLGPC